MSISRCTQKKNSLVVKQLTQKLESPHATNSKTAPLTSSSGSVLTPKYLDLKVRVLVLDGFLLMTIEHRCFIMRWAFSSGSSFSRANLALRRITGKLWFFVFQLVLMLLLSWMWFWYFGAYKFSLRFLFFPNIYHCCIFFYLYFDFSNKIYTVYL